MNFNCFFASWRRSFLRSLALIAAISLTGCNSLYFYPTTRMVLTPEQIGLPYEDVIFPSTDNLKLHGWWLKAKGTPRGTVLFAHGNAENISTHIGAVHWLPAAGFNVFLFDYRGYGMSEGVPSVPGAIADVEAAINTVLARPEVGSQRIIAFGQSLGGALLINALTNIDRDRIALMITESAFSDFRTIARDKLDELWLTSPFRNVLQHAFTAEHSPMGVIGQLEPIPIIVIHGDADATVPYVNAQRLYNAAHEPKQLWTITGGGHIGATLREEYKRRLIETMIRSMTADNPRALFNTAQ